MQAVRRLLDHKAALPVGQQPVQLRRRHSLTERRIRQIDPLKQRLRLLRRRAASEQPRDQFKLRHVDTPRLRAAVDGVSDEIQPRDAQALFVHRIIIERIAALHMRHADHGVMPLQRGSVPHGQRRIPRKDRHALAVGALIVEISPEIKILCPIGRSRTHGYPSFLFVDVIAWCCLRVYLKTHDVTGSEEFLRCARHFFAGILTYFKGKWRSAA